ncbi:hypothetical protein [Polaromonas sp.]|uniref:hypothetical protein n=1 Tax=Polaromonas sp. TaxID=1869339 RepID=UPI0017F89467|nr:hypothetical protein [Polaromonas sp.]NMM07373.1 hypothetical protein [Polaromonas sp.]
MAAQNDSFSPSAAKPGAAVASWRKLDVPLNLVATAREVGDLKPAPMRQGQVHPFKETAGHLALRRTENA